MNGRFLRLLHLEVRYGFRLCLQDSDWCIDMKFVLLHEGKNDDGIRQFFMDVWELYVKVRPDNNEGGFANLQNTRRC
jgi:hypothetical protein